jgi:hypothetical protein
MSTHLTVAQHHAEKIDHFYKHGGTNGYAQATYHLHQIENLLAKVGRSNRDKADIPAIQAILDGVRTKMKEMSQS